MKKIRLLLILISAFFLTSCSIVEDSLSRESVSSIQKPSERLELSGIWKKTEIHEEGQDKIIVDDPSQDIFISKSVLDFAGNYSLNPNISSRFVNLKSYLQTKLTAIPSTLELDNETTSIVKFSNNISFSQDFIMLSDEKLMTISLGKVSVFERREKIDQVAEDEKFKNVQVAIRGEDGPLTSDFGLAISFRRRNPNVTDQLYYDYFTYYIKKTANDEKAKILKVNDVVIPKVSGLWTVSSRKIDDGNGNSNYLLAANPTFLNENEKINKIYDNIYRRIDYVNNNYIGVTNFNYLVDSLSQNYRIFNISNIVNNDAIHVSDIAGNEGNDIFQTAYREASNTLLNRREIEIVETTPDTSNIGLERSGNRWKFVSSIEQKDTNDNTTIFKNFDVNLNPLVGIGQSDTSMFTWREILARRAGAVDSSVAPEKTYILIQTANSIEMYPILHNFIGTQALFTIQNVNNYEIVMTQWISAENIDNIYNEYDKLPKLNSYIIYP